jgi:hypothetical protein
MIRVLGVVVLCATQSLCQVHQSAIAQEASRFNYDRVEVIGKFLAAAYPEIAGADGMLNLDAELPDSADIHFTFRRCHWGSGVPGPGQPPPPVPSCWPSPPVDKQPFIAAHILGFTADRDRPIDSIYLGGSYITDKLETLAFQNLAELERVIQTRSDYIQAMARAIGHTAAHELAHEFANIGAIDGMDVDDAPCTLNGGSQSPSSDPSYWTGYCPGNPPIYLHWEDRTRDILYRCLAGGYRKLSRGVDNKALCQ